MRTINNISRELLDILEPWKQWYDEQEEVPTSKRGEEHTLESATSSEYLETMLALGDKHKGIPEHAYVSDFVHTTDMPKKFIDKSLEINFDLSAFFCAQYSAVHVVYPPGGFMSWHCNWDCPGYNILLSWSGDEEGYFRYRDPLTKEIITVQDQVGWTAKVGYFGGKDEEDKIIWHCAGTPTTRHTFGFVIPDEELWQEMIEDIKEEN